MVLAGGQGADVFTIDQHDEAGFFASKKLLNHHAGTALVVLHAKFVIDQHEIDRSVGFLQRHGDHHTLAGGQTIGLDDDGSAQFVDVGVRRHRVGEGVVSSGGNAMALHKRFGKGLGAFQLRGGLGGPKNLQAMGAKFIDHPGGQGRFGADHGQADFLGLRPFAQGHGVGDGQVFELAAGQGGAAIARGHKHLGRFGRLGQLPRQGVLAATAANNEYFHNSAL